MRTAVFRRRVRRWRAEKGGWLGNEENDIEIRAGHQFSKWGTRRSERDLLTSYECTNGVSHHRASFLITPSSFSVQQRKVVRMWHFSLQVWHRGWRARSIILLAIAIFQHTEIVQRVEISFLEEADQLWTWCEVEFPKFKLFLGYIGQKCGSE